MKRERGEGRVYWVQYGQRGRDYRESSKSADRKVAVRLLRRRLAEIHAGKHAPAAEKVTLADLRRLVGRRPAHTARAAPHSPGTRTPG